MKETKTNYAGVLFSSVEEGKASSSVDSRLKISGMTDENYKGFHPLITPKN